MSKLSVPPEERCLERLMIVCDATKSMGSAMAAIRPVLATVMQMSKLAGKVRDVSVMFYCDYGNPQVVYFSGWGLSSDAIAAFVADQKLWYGFDIPEASRTALVDALIECGDRPTTIVWYTDAPPHYAGCPDDQKLGDELDALEAANAPTTDWVELSRLAADAGHAVYAFLMTENDCSCSFYCALAEITGGAAFRVVKTTSDAIARHTLGLLMLLAGFPHDFLGAVERLSLKFAAGEWTDMLVSEYDCENMLPTMGGGFYARSRISSEPLRAVEPTGGGENAERTLAERFKTSAEYRDVAYDVYSHALLQPLSSDGASVLGSNALVMALWRKAICLDRGDPRRQACCDKMSVLAQNDPFVAGLLEASYDMSAEVEERIAAHLSAARVAAPEERALLLFVPDAERASATHKMIQELGRSCSRSSLERMVALLTGLVEVPLGTPGSLPASIDGLFVLLPPQVPT